LKGTVLLFNKEHQSSYWGLERLNVTSTKVLFEEGVELFLSYQR